jgi:trimeric autotransporter adhesin
MANTMNCTVRRAAWFRLFISFAVLALVAANSASSATTDLTFSPTTIDFKYQAGTPLPAAPTLQIKSSGTALSFTIPPVAAQWLSVSANSGTTPASIKVYVNPTSLPSGSYQGNITVNAPAAATPSQNFVVTLEVFDPTPAFSASAGTLAFTYVMDQAAIPVGQPVILTSTGGAVSATVAASGGTWLSASPSGTVAIIGIPATVIVSVNPAGLAPGNYSGTVKFTPSLSSIAAITVKVTLQVSAGVPTITGLWPPGALVNSPNTAVTVSGANFLTTSVASIGSTTLPAPNVISPTTMLVTIPAALMTAAAPLPITITTATAATPSTTTAASTFHVYVPGPQVIAVTDGASYAVGNISPGEIIAIYGIGLGPASLVPLTTADPLATSLPPTGSATTKVTIDGVDAPLLYTSANQVGCIVPFSVAKKSGSKVDLSVTYNSIAVVAPTKVNVVDANPGLFTMDSSGQGQGAILNVSPTGAYSINSSTIPAVKGSTLAVLYLTGYGSTTCTDIAATASDPGSACNAKATELNLISGAVSPILPVSVTIDGQPAPGALAQAPAGSVPGLMQVNVPVPAGVKPGNVTVVVTLGSGNTQYSSQAKVTMAVK